MRNIKDVVLRNGENLKYVLESHKKWLYDEHNGSKANLIGEDLRDIDFSYIDLKYVNFKSSNLSGSCFKFSDLTGTDFEYADLRFVNFECADLKYAILNKANLKNIIYNDATSFFALQCPEEGSFIGYKVIDNKIIKLLIPKDAKRCSGTSRVCRCSKAKVLSITSLDGEEEFRKVASYYDRNFIYKKRRTAKVKNFDENRWDDWGNGIRFFLTKQEAINYSNYKSL